MLRIEKILAPVDLSRSSGATLCCVGEMVRLFPCSATVLYVGSAAGDTRRKLEEMARTELGLRAGEGVNRLLTGAAQVQSHDREGVVSATSPEHRSVGDPGAASFEIQVQEGDPAATIVRTAKDGHFDLIAMATRGHGPIQQLLLGSVTTQVLDETECPVFTGAHMGQGVRRSGFNNVVCAVDMGPNTERVAGWARDFAAAVGARLFLVHVVPVLGATEEDYYRSDQNVAPAHRAHQELNALRDKLGLAATTIVAGGEIADAVAQQASQLGADVVIGGRGMRAGRLGHLRSQALGIIRAVPCPVITV